MIPEQAIAAGLAAWGKCPAGISPKQQMTNILEAAAPHMLSLSAVEIEAVGDMVKAAKADGWDEGFEGAQGVYPQSNPYRSKQ